MTFWPLDVIFRSSLGIDGYHCMSKCRRWRIFFHSRTVNGLCNTGFESVIRFVWDNRRNVGHSWQTGPVWMRNAGPRGGGGSGTSIIAGELVLRCTVYQHMEQPSSGRLE